MAKRHEPPIKPKSWWQDRLRILWELVDLQSTDAHGYTNRVFYMEHSLCERLQLAYYRLPDGGTPYSVHMEWDPAGPEGRVCICPLLSGRVVDIKV